MQTIFPVAIKGISMLHVHKVFQVPKVISKILETEEITLEISKVQQTAKVIRPMQIIIIKVHSQVIQIQIRRNLIVIIVIPRNIAFAYVHFH